MIAVHTGCVDEEKINDMSYLFFTEVLKELGQKLNYDAVINYAGNSFCKDSWKMIEGANPMNDGAKKNVVGGMMDLFNKSTVIKVNRSDVTRKYSWDEKEQKNGENDSEQ